MKEQEKSLIALAVLGAAILMITPLVTPLVLFSYTKSVPVQVGYDAPAENWILSSVLNEKEAWKMVLVDGASSQVSGDQMAKTESEIGLLFDPLNPYSKTDLSSIDLRYFAGTTLWGGFGDYIWERVPVYDVQDQNWLTTARYKISVYKNGGEYASPLEVNINYQEQRIISMQTPRGAVTITNLGMIPQGVSVPSGDYVIVLDAYNNQHVWNKSDLVYVIERWNNEPKTFFTKHYWSWQEVMNWASSNGILPKDVVFAHVSSVEYTKSGEALTHIVLNWRDIVFAGMITAYIPADLADTIVINLFAPKPVITSVPPALTVKEGQSVSFEVKVRNMGTVGTVSVAVTCPIATISTGTTGFELQEGEERTISCTAYGLNVDGDTSNQIKVFAQGRGGTDTKYIGITVQDVTGATPEPPDGGGVTPIDWDRLWLALIFVALAAMAFLMARKRQGGK